MRLLIRLDRENKSSPSIRLIEILSSNFLSQDILTYIEADEIPIIKFTDTSELFLIKDLDLKHEKVNSDVLVEIIESDLIPISNSGGGADSRPYKVYTALLSQTGTDDPTATVLENTLGFTPTWSRSVTGVYLSLNAQWNLLEKKICFVTLAGRTTNGKDEAYFYYSSEDLAIVLNTFRNDVLSDGVLSDVDNFALTTIEIRVYN